jgi:peroxiredoxin
MRKVVLLSLTVSLGFGLVAAVAVAEETIGDKFSKWLQRAQTLKSKAAEYDVSAAKADASLQEGPAALKAGDLGVGRRLPSLAGTDLDGKSVNLEAGTGNKALLLAFFSANCPLSAKFAPELARLQKDCVTNHVRMILVDPMKDESAATVRDFLSKNGLSTPVVMDKDGAITAALGAKTTTETFLVDAARTLAYRGAINDQYGLGYQIDAPKHLYLREALDAVLKGNLPMIAATSAPGCALDELKAAHPTVAVTYHNQIERILNQNCVECHRADGLAPFSLQGYADVLEHAAMIKKQVTRGVMPPWFAAAPESGHASPWSNDRSLSEHDKTDLLAWLNSDRAQGDPAEAPLPRQFPKGWSIGQPDVVFQIPQPVSIKAEGTMPYQNVTVPTNLTEDRWISGYEIIPTDRSVVHHVIVRLIPPGGKPQDRGEREGFLAAYVPGNSLRLYPEGFAKKLPAGSTLHFQIHYTPRGKQTQDQLKIGLKFATKPPQYVVHITSVANPRINIPPNEANHVETATRPVPVDMMVTAFMPHMHVRGKSFKYELTKLDGSVETLLEVPHYDFNWQLQYRLSRPLFIPRGSIVKITAVYDNSSENHANPDPNKTVRWGEQTTDEMMLGYVEFFTSNTETKMASN